MDAEVDKEILAIVRSIEESADDQQFSFQIADLFVPAIELAKANGRVERAKQLVREYLIFNLVTHTQYGRPEEGRRFYPIYGGTNSDGESVSFPQIDDLKGEAIEYFKMRASATESISMKARYCDFIWEVARDPVFGQMAVDCYLELASAYYRKTWFLMLSDALDRSMYLAVLKVVDDSALSKINKALFEYLRRLLDDKQERFCLELLMTYGRLPSERSSVEELKEMIKTCERCIYHFNEAADYHLERSFLDVEITLVGILGDKEKVQYLRERIAESYLDDAKFREMNDDFLSASTFYKQALEAYCRIGDKEKIDQLKTKQVEVNKKAEIDFKEISAETTISMKDVDDFAHLIHSAEDLEDALKRLALFSRLLPNLGQEIVQTNKQRETSPLQFLITRTTMDKRGHLVGVGRDPFEMVVVRNSMIGIELEARVFLPRIFAKLEAEKGLNAERLFAHMENWGLMEESNLPLIRHGFKKHFEKDYVSAIYVLAPQLEAVIRSLLKKGGIQTIVFKRGTTNTQEATLSDLLKKAEVKEILGEDLHWYMILILVDDLGLNIRNEVAHGLLCYEQCGIAYSLLLIHIFILLTRFVVTGSDKYDLE